MWRCALPHFLHAHAQRRATAHCPPPPLPALVALSNIKEGEWPLFVDEQQQSAVTASTIRAALAFPDSGGSKAAVTNQSGKRTTIAFYTHGSLGIVAEGVNLI